MCVCVCSNHPIPYQGKNSEQIGDFDVLPLLSNRYQHIKLKKKKTRII